MGLFPFYGPNWFQNAFGADNSDDIHQALVRAEVDILNDLAASGVPDDVATDQLLVEMANDPESAQVPATDRAEGPMDAFAPVDDGTEPFPYANLHYPFWPWGAPHPTFGTSGELPPSAGNPPIDPTPAPEPSAPTLEPMTDGATPAKPADGIVYFRVLASADYWRQFVQDWQMYRGFWDTNENGEINEPTDDVYDEACDRLDKKLDEFIELVWGYLEMKGLL